MPNTQDRVTMESIAARLGVSTMTVSRVLAAKEPPRRKKALELFLEIRRLAHELGYRKSLATHAIRTGSYNNVAILGSVDWRLNHMPQVRYRGLLAGAAEHGIGLSLSQLPEDPMAAEPSGLLGGAMCDGALLNFITGYPEGLDENLRRCRIPAVWMNSKHNADCIHPDDFEGSMAATRHLLKLGHKRICAWTFPCTPQTHYSVIDRRRGYEKAMEKAGLEPMFLEMRRSDYPSFIPKVMEILKGPSRPTAFITYGPTDAAAVYGAALSLGLKVPEDLSIVTFDDDKPIKETFGFCTMILPEFELGRQAVGLIVRKIASPDEPIPPVALPLALETRSSACPPGGG